MTTRKKYNHLAWEPIRRFLKIIMKYIGFQILAKFDSVEGMENIPEYGPGIIMYNHIAFIDPVAILAKIHRNVIPLAKEEALNLPFFGIFARLWGSIPIRRGEVDRDALETMLDVLNQGEIILLAPEGTRNPALIEAKDGIAFLALRSGAPIIPVAVEGTSGFPSFDPKRWRQPGIRIRFGRAFRFKKQSGRVTREALHTMTEEAMYRLAAILPPERRGFYRDLGKATETMIEPLSHGEK
jgi:1-acyl-sn-glycerol-3-phosphate acyltransferase